MEYYDKRGVIQCPSYFRQPVSFEGIAYRGTDGRLTGTPTDIDGVVQMKKENIIIFFELKHHGDIPTGQKITLESICDNLRQNGVNSVVFLAEHHTPHNETIVAKKAIVTACYNGKWNYYTETRTLGNEIQRYIKYIGGRHEH